MKIAIILSAPSLRQVFRGNDPRAVAIVTERTLWPLMEAGDDIGVEIQCDDPVTKSLLATYFHGLLVEQKSVRAAQSAASKAGDSAKA